MVSGLVLLVSSWIVGIPYNFNRIGKVIDEFNGVKVHYNGNFSHVGDRNLSKSGYNIGLKWQCVEFVKRYYLEVYRHEMPNTQGNAIDYIDSKLEDAEFNRERGLNQFSNPSKSAPKIGEIVVFNEGFGHLAIVSKVFENKIEIIQQNVGYSTRDYINLKEENNRYFLNHPQVIGRLGLNEHAP